MSGFWDKGCKQVAHITLLELSTVRLALQEFVHMCRVNELLESLQRREVIRIYKDNQVIMHVINSMVSRSSTLMAELRRLHNLLQEHNLTLKMRYLPSALNLFADRLSRRRRAFAYLPSIPGLREHWWVRASEQDMKTTWGNVELLCPPMDLMALVPEKVKRDDFKGLMLIPWWPRQNWFHELLGLGADHVDSSRVHRGLRSPPTGPEPAGHGAYSSEAVEHGSNSILSRSMSAGRRVGRVAEFTASRLTGSAPDGASGSGYLEKSAELISKGYWESPLSALDNSTRRFIEFCEADGFKWEEAGLHAMLAWLSYTFHSTSITGETAEQYVSSVNAAYATMGLQPPAKPAGSWRLYHDVRMALAGFTKARLEGGGRDPKCHVPTTAETIERLRYLTLKALDGEDLPMARAALANVWQYFNFSRPTMTAFLDWDRLEFLSAVKVKMTIPRVAAGRKNTGLKKKTLVFSRSIPPDVDPQWRKIHPIVLIGYFRRIVDRVCLRKRCAGPKKVWQLPGETATVARKFTSVAMNKWLRYSAPAARIQLDPDLTVHGHCAGSATAARKLKVDVAEICHIADWELTGKELNKTYYHRDLECCCLFPTVGIL
jgi:hypothetical protein